MLSLTSGLVMAAPHQTAHKPLAAASVRQALQALYNQQDLALAHRDVRGAMACDAPDYIAVGQDGVSHTRDEQFDALEKLCAGGQNLRQHSLIQDIVAQKDRASLVLWQQSTMTVFNPNTHTSVALRTEGVTQDLWVRTPDGWRLTYSKSAWQRSATDDAAVETPAATPPKKSAAQSTTQQPN
jgi:hypothetical protein